MKLKKRSLAIILLLVLTAGVTLVASYAFKVKSISIQGVTRSAGDSLQTKACVFKTIFGEESSDSNFIYKTPVKVQGAITEAMTWMAKAQLPDGGWGSGSHYHQEVMDPHEVKADPATTAIVSMSLLRCQNTPSSGQYSANLNKAVNYLLLTVENSPDASPNITDMQGTQPQIKLGGNIDVILTSQFLTNLLEELGNNPNMKARVKKCINKCVAKIQKSQDANGSFKGSGWAGVLQSSLANNALETAQQNGINVDTMILDKSRNFQKGNVDVKTGNVKTDMGAGVMLYSISSSGRASAKEAKVAKEEIEQAKNTGKLGKDEKVTAANLQKIGLSYSAANKYAAAYDINESSKQISQRGDVMNGFGSNGGEEFLSYLQTGEGMIVSKDNDWKKWYDNVSGKLLKIQNNDGSWNGHHCITSPVFCTATCLLILSVNNDVEHLLQL
jgi:hypothetical protein